MTYIVTYSLVTANNIAKTLKIKSYKDWRYAYTSQEWHFAPKPEDTVIVYIDDGSIYIPPFVRKRINEIAKQLKANGINYREWTQNDWPSMGLG